jgi:two-component system OmpR family sensor kinase
MIIHRAARVVRRHLPPSVRAQMTLFYTAGFAFLLAIILIISYAFIRVSAVNQEFSALDTFAHGLAERIAYQNGRNCLYASTPALPGWNNAIHYCSGEPDGAPTVPLTVTSTSMIRMLKLDGKSIIYQSPAFAPLIVPDVATNVAMQGEIWRNQIQGRNGQHVDLWSGSLIETGQTGRVLLILQVAQPSTVITSDSGLGIILLLSYPVLVVLGGFASYALATRAFRPIHRLTRAASNIARGDLHQRVPVPLAHDDIHTLATTFNEMAARLESAFARQRRFVADASHELRTPVAVIRSMTDVTLAGEPSREEAVAALREVNAEVVRLGRLINTLLGLARADDGRLEHDHEIVRLDLLVADVVESVTPLAQERGLSLTARRLDHAQVAGDTAQIIQIIMSLVDNALNYTPNGGIVTLAVEVVGDQARVTVSDTGIGIGSNDLPHIFERFYRADAARSRVMGGSGLGLALAQEFTRAHTGALTVQSRVGQGSSFTLALPLARAEKA